MSQLAIAFDVSVDTPKPEWWAYRTEQQQQEWLGMLERVKQQRIAIEAIARELFPESNFDKLYRLPADQYSAACAEYHKRNPRPELLRLWPSIQAESGVSKTAKKERFYQQWPIERKWKNRVRKLQERAMKRFSLLPDERCEWLQEELLKNPQYYGVCPLPDCGVLNCKLNWQDYDPTRQAAIEKENALRGYVPLQMPVSIPQREPELIAVEAKQKVEEMD